jgi:hypothetical protein
LQRAIVKGLMGVTLKSLIVILLFFQRIKLLFSISKPLSSLLQKSPVMKKRFFQNFLAFVVLAIVIIPNNAFAYIDPGTGSYILQIIAAGILGGLFAIKMFWFQVKDFFRRLFSRNK